MHINHLSIRKMRLMGVALAALLASYSHAQAADTLLSGFEGTLSTAIGTDWKFYDASGDPGDQIWSHSYVTEGVAEGTHALKITHFPGWTHGFNLVPGSEEARTQLINLFATHDAIEFDLTTGPGTSWRQLFFIVNSSVTGWSQVQIDIPQNTTTHFVMPLTNPDPADPAKNWKQSAIDGGATATYWEIFFALQGGDAVPTADFDIDMDADGADFLIWQQNVGNMAAGQEQGDSNFDAIVDGLDLDALRQEFGRSSQSVSTIIDNIKFTGGPAAVAAVPEPASFVAGLAGLLVLSATAARRRR